MSTTTTTPNRRLGVPAYFLGRPRSVYLDRYARRHAASSRRTSCAS